MKKLVTGLMVLALSVIIAGNAAAYNFGDYRSETLASKAWNSLNENDLESVLAYTNKCIELYGEQAVKMQDSLTDFAQGPDDHIFSYWALNDVATSLFIQGEASSRSGSCCSRQKAWQSPAGPAPMISRSAYQSAALLSRMMG